ncbi:MAG: ATP-binding protein [Syntrophomonadaceae bacterium]
MQYTKETLSQEISALNAADGPGILEAGLAFRPTSINLDSVIKASPDGIGITSLDAKVQVASDKLLLMYGYPLEDRSELIGKSVLEFIDPSEHEYLIQGIRRLAAGESDNKIREYLAVKKDGSKFYVELNYAILPDSNGRPESILVIQRDCTERKRIQEETYKLNLELAELNATKDKFFSLIAHDLKSPFQALIGCSQILSSEYETLSEEEKLSFIGSIEELSRNSYRLLENLLEWSRIQTGQMAINMEEFNLLVELYPTISLLKQTAMNKNISFQYSIDNSIFVKADKNIVSSIIRNLVANSIKFTKPGGSIILLAVKSGASIEFSVADTGIGMQQEILNDLFTVGKCVSRRGTANEDGTGLGLLLCKEMIVKHGGKIWAESQPGKGSTFSFKINSSM